MTSHDPSSHTSPRVIVVNGPSSSGKSSVSAALQDALPGLWYHFGVDTITGSLPGRLTSLPPALRPDDQALLTGSFPHALEAFHGFLGDVARAGVNVIVDTVLHRGRPDQESLARDLEGVDVLWLGLRADVGVLESRERDRGDRAEGLARVQADSVHRGVQYDLELDSATASPADLARQVASHLERRS